MLRNHLVYSVDDSMNQTTKTRKALTEEAQRNGEAQLRMLIETLPDLVWLKNPEGVYLACNRKFERLYGTTQSEIVGKTDDDFVDENLADFSREKDQAAIATGQPCTNEEEVSYADDGHTELLETVRTPMHDSRGRLVGVLGIARDITERKRVEEELQMLSVAVEQSPASVVITDTQGTIEYVNPRFTEVTGYTAKEAVGQNPRILKSGKWPKKAYKALWNTILGGKTWTGEFENRKKSGEVYWETASISPIRNTEGTITHFLAVKQNITARKKAEQTLARMNLKLQEEQEQLKATHAQLLHAQKMESIGQLAAGIAHEINTPIQFVGDNTRFQQNAFTDLSSLLQNYERLRNAAMEGTVTAELLAEVKAAVEKADLEYVFEEIPKAIEQSLEGVERVATIVRSMKEFSHPGGNDKQPADLNKAIESTITVSRNEWKYVAEMNLELDSALPPVPCLLGDFNQVVLNIIVNAAHAITDVVGKDSGEKGAITVSTRQDGDWAEICISDTGAGMAAGVCAKVFEPFFTTKEVGKGTGQGLTIARSVVVQKHGGTIDIESRVGKGTTFTIRLPIDEKPNKPAETRDHETANPLC